MSLDLQAVKADISVQQVLDQISGQFPVVLQDGSVTTVKLATPQAWQVVGAGGQPAFGTSWSSTAGFESVAFYKDLLGVVHLRGVLTAGGGAASVAFILPAGYRPSAVKAFITFGNLTTDTIVDLRIDSAGAVYLDSGIATTVALDGISFRAA